MEESITIRFLRQTAYDQHGCPCETGGWERGDTVRRYGAAGNGSGGKRRGEHGLSCRLPSTIRRCLMRRASSRAAFSRGKDGPRRGRSLPPGSSTGRSAPLREGLPQRDPDHCDGALGGPGERPGRARHHRRLGRPYAFPDTLSRPAGRGDGGKEGRSVHHQPDKQARGKRSRHRRGRLERRDHDGRGRSAAS